MAIEQTHRDASDAESVPRRDDLVTFIRSCRHVRYSPKADILFVYRKQLEPGFTVEPGGCLAYRVSHDKTRIVAVELHNFKSLVLPANPQLALAWKEFASPFKRLARTRDRTLHFLLDKVMQCVASSDEYLAHT